MQYDDFLGHVQHRAQLATVGEAERAVRATLTTLGERLHVGEAGDLAAQLPEGVAQHLHTDHHSQRFDRDEFFERVSKRESVDLPAAVHHCRAVLDVLSDAVGPNQMEHVRGQLPDEFTALFAAGSTGQM